MTRKQDWALKIASEYGEVIDKHPKLAEAIEKLIDEHEKLREIEQDNEKISSILAHELKSPLISIEAGLKLILSGKFEGEKMKKCLEDALGKLKYTTEIADLLYLRGLSNEEIRKNSEMISLEEIAKNHAGTYDEFMKKERIGLKLKYDRPNHEPIYFITNKALINAVWGTLLGNSLSWAPSDSVIKNGIRINKSGNLEILMENYYDEKKVRDSFGMGEGKGLSFVKKVVYKTDGEYHQYSHPKIESNYTIEEKWGYLKSKNQDNKSKFFGVKIVLHSENINPEFPNQKQIVKE